MQHFIGVFPRGDCVFLACDVLTQDIHCRADPLIVELTYTPDRILQCLARDVTPGEMTDDRLRDGRQRCDNKFVYQLPEIMFSR